VSIAGYGAGKVAGTANKVIVIVGAGPAVPVLSTATSTAAAGAGGIGEGAIGFYNGQAAYYAYQNGDTAEAITYGYDSFEAAAGSAAAGGFRLRVPRLRAGTPDQTSNVVRPPGHCGLPSLSPGQTVSLARFTKKLPSGNTGITVDHLGTQVIFTSEVPGIVPGSSAVYQKVVDPSGQTTIYVKTTLAPDGHTIHIKDKLNGGEIPHF
jgi:hypothetical protein